MGRAKIAITEQQLRGLLDLTDGTDIRAVTAHQDPLTVYVHVTNDELPDLPQGSEAPIFRLTATEGAAEAQHRSEVIYTNEDDGVHLRCVPCQAECLSSLEYAPSIEDLSAAWAAHVRESGS